MEVSTIRDIIRSRRSVFPPEFIEKEIDKDILTDVLENANWAPSHKLTQPWRFKVLMGDSKGRLADFMAERYKQNCSGGNFLEKKHQKLLTNPRKAAAIVLICMHRDPEERIPEWEELASVSAAVQNMWLSCHAHGIGGYWSTPALIEDIGKDFLILAENEQCIGIFYMGYHQGTSKTSKRNPIESNVEWLDND